MVGEFFPRATLRGLLFAAPNIAAPSFWIFVTSALVFLGPTTLAMAADPLGTVSAQSVPCSQVRGEGGVPNGACYLATVSCPGTPDIPVGVKVNRPPRNSRGTVLFNIGGGGITWYDLNFIYGALAIESVRQAGFTAVQFAFEYPPVGQGNGSAGWLAGPGGPRTLACRWVTLAQWVHDNIRQADSAFCATGNSAAAGAAGYALAHYGMAPEFNMLEQTSGPPFSRIDQGCLCNAPPVQTPCVPQPLSECYGAQAQAFIDPAYGNTACSRAERTHRSQYEQIFLDDSLDSADAQFNFPTTDIHFVFGGLDDGHGVPHATLWLSEITGKGPPTVSCVADAPHEIADVVDGAKKIANDLITFCHK